MVKSLKDTISRKSIKLWGSDQSLKLPYSGSPLLTNKVFLNPTYCLINKTTALKVCWCGNCRHLPKAPFPSVDAPVRQLSALTESPFPAVDTSLRQLSA